MLNPQVGNERKYLYITCDIAVTGTTFPSFRFFLVSKFAATICNWIQKSYFHHFSFALYNGGFVAFLIKSKIQSRLNFPLRFQRACELSFQFYFICIIFFLANRLDYSWKKYSTWQIIFVLYVEI